MTARRWLEAVDAAFARFAGTDDDAALREVICAWDEDVDRERVSARLEPDPRAWEAVEERLAREGLASPGAVRAVFRDPWEKLERALVRLDRLRELAGPGIFVDNERSSVPELLVAIDAAREPVGQAPLWDRIATATGDEILDLSQLGWRVAELAAGAFPRSVGRGAGVEQTLAPETRTRMQRLACLDDYWAIHGARFWENGGHARHLVPDADLWEPPGFRAAYALELPASSPSRTCLAWRRLMPAVPVGDRGGPLFVQMRQEDCVVSFVLVTTGEQPGFLPEEW